jgi:hypothetical protein
MLEELRILGVTIIPSNLSIQTTAFEMFLNEYNPACAGIDVEYVPWGNKVGQALSGTIFDTDSAREFGRNISGVKLSPEFSAATDHAMAMEMAAQLLAGNYEKKVLIFITDEVAQVDLRKKLSQLVPADVIVFGIGIGDKETADYVRDYIVPLHGHNFRAETPEELQATFTEAFKQLNMFLCMS